MVGFRNLMMNNRGINILVFLVMVVCATAQTFRTEAPSVVHKGQQFHLKYTLINAEGTSFKPISEDIKGFTVLFGPSTSSSHSTSIVNGKASSSSSVSYVYTLTADAEGTFTLPGTSIVVNGKRISSQSVKVKVLPENRNPSASSQNTDRLSRNAPATTQITEQDAFIRTIVSRTKVREQEAFTVTFRFYTRFEVDDVSKIEFPEFEGFVAEEVSASTSVSLVGERYNGRMYYAADLKKVLLFPQRTGKLTIPAGEVDMTFRIPSGVQSFFGEDMMVLRRKMKSKPIDIQIDALPTPKPANFSGGVGTFTLQSQISTKRIKANDAVTLKLTFNGTGNFKLLKTPDLNLPDEIEGYDPQILPALQIADDGLTGSQTIEYLLIPRYEGRYTIPSLNISYFNTQSGRYETLTTPEYHLQVDKDPNASEGVASNFGTNSEKEKLKDIQPLYTQEYDLQDIDNHLFGSIIYYLWYLIPSLLLIGFIAIYRKHIRENSDIALVRHKKANKVAIKRLKNASEYLRKQENAKFYEEILRALWGYLSDKLAIPVSELNRDNIATELEKFGADEDCRNTLLHVLDTAQFARYAPAQHTQAIDQLYQATIDTIGQIEQISKQKVSK